MNALTTSNFIYTFIYLNINKKNFFNIFKMNMIIEDILDCCCSEEIVNKI